MRTIEKIYIIISTQFKYIFDIVYKYGGRFQRVFSIGKLALSAERNEVIALYFSGPLCCNIFIYKEFSRYTTL